MGELLNNETNPVSSWINQHPFDMMDDMNQTYVHDLSKLLDEKFDLKQKYHRNNGDNTTKVEVDAEHDIYVKTVHTLHECMEELLVQRFPDSRLSLYGSCLSDLSLGKTADVDISLYIESLDEIKYSYEMQKISEQTYRSSVKRYVIQTCRTLEKNTKYHFKNMIPVTRARVPVVKGTYVIDPNHPDSNIIPSLDFDITFLNDIAVTNSELIRQYSLVHPSIKSLMRLIKKWSKVHNICSAQDKTISSYAWMNLVIFYVQAMGMVPNLQCPELIQSIPNVPTNKYWDNINQLNTQFLTWEQASTVWNGTVVASNIDRYTMSISSLFYGFFDFYVNRYSTSQYAISIRHGGASTIPKLKSCFKVLGPFWCIEDPFEIAESHTPHDLGMHANDIGATMIMDCMKETEEYLRTKVFHTTLLGNNNSNDHSHNIVSVLSEIHHLWPDIDIETKLQETKKMSKQVRQYSNGNVQKVPPAKQSSSQSFTISDSDFPPLS